MLVAARGRRYPRNLITLDVEDRRALDVVAIALLVAMQIGDIAGDQLALDVIPGAGTDAIARIDPWLIATLLLAETVPRSPSTCAARDRARSRQHRHSASLTSNITQSPARQRPFRSNSTPSASGCATPSRPGSSATPRACCGLCFHGSNIATIALSWRRRKNIKSIQPIDFAAVARGFGMPGFSVEDPAQCRDVLWQALSTRGPALVEAVVDPHEPPMPPKVTLKEAAHLAESLARGTPAAGKIALTIASDTVREIV
jgi:hypothetical protein